MKKIAIAINGPKYSGKSTVAGIIQDGLRQTPWVCTVDAFAAPLEAGIKAVLHGTVYEDTFAINRHSTDPVVKRHTPVLPVSDASAAQMMIAFSEDFLKVQYGQGIMGWLCAKRQEYRSQRHIPTHVHVVQDCGFQKEFDVYKDHMTAQGFEVHLINVVRPGTDHSGDSREDVTHINPDRQHTLHNPYRDGVNRVEARNELQCRLNTIMLRIDPEF